jgi:phospholipid/cholesterol/gamma-HCH transport system substrate-binding protein
MSGLYQVHWSQLRIGVIVSLITVASSILIFFIDDVRDAVDDRYSLYFRTFTTQTLRPRAPVWLAGQPVGHVRDLALEPPSGERGGALIIELSIGADAQPFITEGAAAQITSSSLLGEAVVNIIPATEPARPLFPGEELTTAAELDPFQVSSTLEVIYDSVRPIADRWREVAAQIQEGRGTLPQLVRHPEQVYELRANLSALSATLDTLRIAATGLADLLTDPAVRTALDSLGPRFQLLAQRWGKDTGNFTRLAGDTVLAGRFDAMSTSVERIVARLEAGQGTLGRLLHDPALAQALAGTRESLRRLRADLESTGLKR